MIIDPRVTPTDDTVVSKVPGFQDNPANRRLTAGQVRLSMEVAAELGVDPNNLDAFGLTAEKIEQYETQLHGRNSRNNNKNR